MEKFSDIAWAELSKEERAAIVEAQDVIDEQDAAEQAEIERWQREQRRAA